MLSDGNNMSLDDIISREGYGVQSAFVHVSHRWSAWHHVFDLYSRIINSGKSSSNLEISEFFERVSMQMETDGA